MGGWGPVNGERQQEKCNLVPRVFSAFKMAAWRRPWQTAGDGRFSIVSNMQRALWLTNLRSRDLLFARFFSEPPF